MVSAGGQSACEIREDTTLWCWGNAAYGQVGNGDTRDRTNPQQVGTSGWADVSASGATTCAVRLDQTLWCWGMNHRGQLGTGGKTRSLVPVQIAPAQRFTKVATGWLNTCAIGADTSLWCWGDNSRGQVGRREHRHPLRADPRRHHDGLDLGEPRRLLRLRHPGRRHRQLLGPELLRPARHRLDREPHHADHRRRRTPLAAHRRRLGDHVRPDDGGRGLLLGPQRPRPGRLRRSEHLDPA